MRSIAAYSVSMIVSVLLVNSIVNITLESYLMRILVSSLLLIIIISLFMLSIKKKVDSSAKSISHILNEYIGGNFLAELREKATIRELSSLHKDTYDLGNRLKDWLYNLLYAEVHIKELAKQIHLSSSTSFKSMENISNSMVEVIAGSDKATNGTSESAAISEELLSSTSEISSYTSNFRDVTLESIKAIEEDSQEIDKTLENVSEIEEIMNQTSGHIGELEGFLEAISSMTSAIGDIANQTNLLSLNASIEAARAGEMGRGFGVVAEEIKKLANQSYNTSSDINDKLELIRNSIGEVIVKIKTGAEKSVEIKDKSGRAAHSLKNINEKIKAMGEFINSISYNIEQQTAASESLARNTEGIAGFTNELDETIKEMRDRVLIQVKEEEKNMEVSNGIIDVSKRLDSFIEAFEKEVNKEMISACKEISKLLEKGVINNEFLKKLSQETGISEFYITDGAGVTVLSNNPNGIGFTFTNDPGTQAYEFYRILEDPKLQVCQPMRIRDIDGQYCKFAAVGRTDTKGIIQVGVKLEDITKFHGQYVIK